MILVLGDFVYLFTCYDFRFCGVDGFTAIGFGLVVWLILVCFLGTIWWYCVVVF